MLTQNAHKARNSVDTGNICHIHNIYTTHNAHNARTTCNRLARLKTLSRSVLKQFHVLNKCTVLVLAIALALSPLSVRYAQASYDETPTLGSVDAAYTITELSGTYDTDDYYKTFTVTNTDKTETTYGIMLKKYNADASNNYAATTDDITKSIVDLIISFTPTEGDTTYKITTEVPTGETPSFTISINGEAKTFYVVNFNGSDLGTTQVRERLINKIDSNTYSLFIGLGSSSDSGGAIFNTQTTTSPLKADFIDNSAAVGGAIYNFSSGTAPKITTIEGNFIANSASSNGGAIYNYACNGTATIEKITGDFIANTAQYGGAISNLPFTNNTATIGNITGDFIANTAQYGGAIYNFVSISQEGTIAKIDSITGDFIGNYATSTANDAYGGAIYNSSGTLGDIKGDFIGNYATSTENDAYGGAIYNTGTIGDIVGDFTDNSVTGSNNYAYGGAIYNSSGTIGDIVGDFIGNYTNNTNQESRGGAIYNTGTIYDISGNFIKNYAQSTNSNAEGGAIFNEGASAQIGNILGDFIDNSAQKGGAIYTGGNSGTTITAIGSLESPVTFSGNNATSSGGAIYNISGKIGDTEGVVAIVANFTNNTSGYNGGAIYNSSGTIGTEGEVAIKADFTSNTAANRGGAIYNTGTIYDISGNFIGNYAKTTNDTAYGGAIYTTKDLTFVADSASYEFTNNYTNTSGEIDYNAIYVAASSVDLTFNISDSNSFTMNDSILGSTTYNVAISGNDNSSIFKLNDEIDKNGIVSVENATLTLGEYGHTDGFDTAQKTYGSILGELNVNDGATINFTSNNVVLNTVNLNAGTFNINSNYYNTIKSAFTWTGGIFAFSSDTDTLTIADGGSLTISTAPSTTVLTLSNDLNVESGASLNITSGTLDISDATLSVAESVATFATEATGTLKIALDNLGTIEENGDFTWDTTYIKTQLDNAGNLTLLADANFTKIDNTVYEAFLADIVDNNAVSTGGTITLEGVEILGKIYSLYNVPDNAGLLYDILAGELTDNKIVSATGIVKNTYDPDTEENTSDDTPITESTIASGSKLTLTGANEGNVLLDEGSIFNEGILILGSASVESAHLQGKLDNKASGETTVLSNINITETVLSEGTLTFKESATLKSALTVSGGTTTFGDDSTTDTARIEGRVSVANGGKLIFNANATITQLITSDGTLKFNGTATLENGLYASAGTTTFNGATTITGSTEIYDTGTATFADNATFNDGLTIKDGGIVNFTGDTTVSGAITSSGELNFEKSATLNGNLQINDDTSTFKDTATITGITTIVGGNLIFESSATLNELKVADSGTTTFNGLSEVQGTTTLNGGNIEVNTGSNLTLADLNLNDGTSNGIITVNGTLTMGGTITWDTNEDGDDNKILVNSGATFITGTNNIYTYTSGSTTVDFATNLDNNDLAFVDVSTLSFSGVTEISKEEYDAVKKSLYNVDSAGTSGFGDNGNTDFLFDFGDAVVTGVAPTEIVGTDDNNNVNIEYNVPSTVATPDGSKLTADTDTSTNITTTAGNSGSMGGLIFTNVDDSTTSLVYDVGSQSITFSGATADSSTDSTPDSSTATALVGATTVGGSQIIADVTVGDSTNSTAGTLNLGTTNTSENKTGTLNSVTLTSESTMNVTGSTQGTEETPITSSFTVAESTKLDENTKINVDNNATLNLGGTTSLAEGSSISVKGQSTTIIDSITVSNTNASDIPYVYADPSYVGIKDISGDTLDFHIYVSEGSVINVGDGQSIVEGTEHAEELKALFEKMDYFTTSDLATGGFIPTNKLQTMLYLGLGKTLTLGQGNIVVDDTVTDDSVDGIEDGQITLADGSTSFPSGVYFGADSFLVADLTGFSEDMAVLDGSNKTLYVDVASTLGIVGATAGTYTILTNFTPDADSDIWDYDEANNDIDVYVGNTLQEIASVTGDGTSASPYQVTIGIVEDSTYFHGPVGEIVKNAANYQGEGGFSSNSDNAGVRFIYNVTSYADKSKQEPIIEGAAQLSAAAGTNASTYYANRAAVNTQQGRYHLYDVTVGSESLRDSGANSSSDLNVITRNADGSIKAEYSGVTQVASSASLDNVYNNDNSVALWFMPFYAHENVSGMKAGSYRSDYKSDMYGVAVGADKTFTQVGAADAVRIGLAFNVGLGETTSSGDFNHIENDFDFFGVSAYAAVQFDKFTLSADLGYSRNSSDITQNLSSYSVENLKSDVDSDIWFFGLRGEYTHTLANKLKIIPYLGLELLTIKTEDYNVNANTALGGTIFTVESDRQNVLSIPVGVTISKNFALENGWNISPEARIGGIFAMGDLNEESTARMPGIDGIAHMNMEVVDPATLDVGLGLDAMYNNLRFSLDYNLQVSRNRTAHGVMGVVEFKF